MTDRSVKVQLKGCVFPRVYAYILRDCVFEKLNQPHVFYKTPVKLSSRKSSRLIFFPLTSASSYVTSLF